jgi:hypothetical protein
MSRRALPPSGDPDPDDIMDDDLTLQRYNEEIEHNIRAIREGESNSPWGLHQNVLEPPPSSGTSDGIEDVLASAPLHIRRLTAGPSYTQKDKHRAPLSRTETPIYTGLWQLQDLQAEVRRLEAEKSAALRKVNQLQTQQASTSSFLQRTAADVQNLSSASTAAQQALSTSNATTIGQLAAMINERFDRVDANTNALNRQANRRHDEYIVRTTNIERRLTAVEGNPVAPQPLSPPANLQQLILQAANMQPPLPSLPNNQQQQAPCYECVLEVGSRETWAKPES